MDFLDAKFGYKIESISWPNTTVFGPSSMKTIVATLAARNARKKATIDDFFSVVHLAMSKRFRNVLKHRFNEVNNHNFCYKLKGFKQKLARGSSELLM